MVFLLFFIAASLLFGGFTIGPFSIRVYSTIILIVYCLFLTFTKQKAKSKLAYNFIYVYIIFLLLTFLSKTLTEHSYVNNYLRFVFSHHIVAITAFCGVSLLVKTEKQIRYILVLLIAIGVINGLVSILQANGNEFGFLLGRLFYSQESQYAAETEQRVVEYGAEFGEFVVQGLFGEGANNGLMTGIIGILPLCVIISNKRNVAKCFGGIICFSILIISSYYIQERAAFLLLIFFSFLTIWKYSRYRVLILLICIVGGIVFVTNNIDNMGRFSYAFEFGDDRSLLVSNALSFISENWFLGGEAKYSIFFGLTPHNFILHALIYSGFFGSLVIFYLFIKMFLIAINSMKKSFCSPMTWCLASSTLIFHINGLVHSSSIITGDVIIWLLFALLLKSIKIQSL